MGEIRYLLCVTMLYNNRASISKNHIKKHLIFIFHVSSYCPMLLSETLCFSSCLFKAPLLNTQPALIGQIIHAWASNHPLTTTTGKLNRTPKEKEKIKKHIGVLAVIQEQPRLCSSGSSASRYIFLHTFLSLWLYEAFVALHLCCDCGCDI